MRGFHLTPQNRPDRTVFLRILTDEPLIRNPAFSNPWRQASGGSDRRYGIITALTL